MLHELYWQCAVISLFGSCTFCVSPLISPALHCLAWDRKYCVWLYLMSCPQRIYACFSKKHYMHVMRNTVHQHFKQGKSCWYPLWMANHPQEHLSHWWLKETMSTELPSNPCYHQLTSHTVLLCALASSVAWLKQGPLDAYSNAASVQHYVLILINFQRHHKSDTSTRVLPRP